ncbi:MAG: hypothetical protein CTY28_14475 [Hyphomicrobium sp.]|nr:MAG: hypothetical protein CTY28_14475 [Hyphomicrobium sp.]
MKFEPLTWADLQDTGNAQSQLVLVAIARHADWDNGTCYPSQRALSEMAKCSARTIRRHIKQLVADGFITISERFAEGGERTSNLFTLVGYVDWVRGLRQGGGVAKPKRAKRYRDDDLSDDEPPAGSEPDGGDETPPPGQVGQGGEGVDNLSIPRGQQVSIPPGQQVSRPNEPSLELSLEPSPLTPRAGGKQAKIDRKAKWIADLRGAGRNRNGVENFVVPLLASDKRLSLGDDQGATLAEWAGLAQDLPTPALTAAVKRLTDQPKKVTSADVRQQLNVARTAGAMIVIRRGSPQWSAWMDHWRSHDPVRAKLASKYDAWQAPADFPPGHAATHAGGAA